MTYPKRIILSIEPFYLQFLNSPGVNGNIQIFQEITKQIFDIMDTTFSNFTQKVGNLPRLQNLVNHEKYTENLLRLLKNSLKDYALAIYFVCYDNKIIVNEECVYMLESMSVDYIVLYYRK